MAIVGKSRCARHADEIRQRDRDRGSASSRGYGRKWQAARADYLSAHPLCVRCREAGRVEAATEVDHIEAHRGDLGLFWRRSNWQALCKPCHSRKTATEDGGFGNADRPPGAV